jgi:hypothetical protein
MGAAFVLPNKVGDAIPYSGGEGGEHRSWLAVQWCGTSWRAAPGQRASRALLARNRRAGELLVVESDSYHLKGENNHA